MFLCCVRNSTNAIDWPRPSWLKDFHPPFISNSKKNVFHDILLRTLKISRKSNAKSLSQCHAASIAPVVDNPTIG